MQYGFKITTHGRAAIAGCLAQSVPLVIRAVEFGRGHVDDSTDLADVHALIDPVGSGNVAECIHEGEQMRLTVQYCNADHADIPTFYLSEFMVYATDPDTGDVTDLLYATLGDYTQPVPAYNPELPASVFSFPLAVIVSSEIDVSITASPGIVTHDDLRALIAEGVIGIAHKTVTVVTTDWQLDATAGGGATYPYYADVADPDIRSRMVPSLSFGPGFIDVASAAGVSPSAVTATGSVRIFAASRPRADLTADLALIGGSGSIGSAGDSYVLPPATATTLGGVMIGAGVAVTADGTISVDHDAIEDAASAVADAVAGRVLQNAIATDPDDVIADDDEVDAVLDEIFGPSDD